MNFMQSKPCLYVGSVFHKRFRPKVHALKYSVFTLFGDLDDMQKASETTLLFSCNRFNLLSFHERDHGNIKSKDERPLKDRMISLLNENGIGAANTTRISVLTYPRILGFAFNPLTVFFCLSDKGTPLAVIYEVRNTFGERHNYLFKIPEGGSFADHHQAEKCFHVSPFFDREGTYQFRLEPPQDTALVSIGYAHTEGKRLIATFSGHRTNLNNKNILSLCGKMPFMTIKVVAGILWEALKLWSKGLRVFTHPEKHPYKTTRAFTSEKSKETLIAATSPHQEQKEAV